MALFFYNSVKYYIMGALVLILFFLSIYKVFFSSVAHNNSYRYKAHFSNITDLTVNSPVLVSGYKVGQVSKLYLDKEYNPVVILSINKSVSIPDDSSLSIKEVGIFSNKVVQLNLGVDDISFKNYDTIIYTTSGMSILEIINLLIDYASTIKKRANA